MKLPAFEIQLLDKLALAVKGGRICYAPLQNVTSSVKSDVNFFTLGIYMYKRLRLYFSSVVSYPDPTCEERI